MIYSKIKDVIINNIILQHSIWAVLGSSVLRGAGIIASIYVAKITGADAFGAYGMLKNFVLSLAVFSTFGLGYTATKFVAENRMSPNRLRIIIKNSNKVTFILSLIITCALFFSSKEVAQYLFKNLQLDTPVKIIAVWLFFNALTTLQQGILAGFGFYKIIAKINTYIGVFSFIITIIFTKVWLLEGALTALLISQIFNFLLNFKVINQELRSASNNEDSILEIGDYSIYNLIKISFPITLNELSYSFFGWLSSYLIIIYYNYSQLGIYNAAMQWYMIIIFIPGVLRNVVLSSLSSNRGKEINIVKQMLWINFITSISIAFVIFIFSSMITKIYGTSFEGVETVINILSLCAVITSLCNVYIQTLISKSHFWTVFISRLGYDSLTVALFVAVIMYYPNENGALIMSLVLLGSTILYYLISILLYKKSINS